LFHHKFEHGLSGVSIGTLFSIMSITTSWMSDIKLGYCKTGWWMNRKFCCWEIEVTGVVGGGGGEAGCEDWRNWPIGMDWISYVGFAVSILSS
jgi:chloride channel 3/4/5